MIFSSSLFLLYFIPVFLLVYYVIDKKYRNIFVILASMLFFTWGAPVFSIIILASLLFDFFLLNIMKNRNGKTKNVIFWILVIINLGMLVYFKYTNFLIDNINPLIKLMGIKALATAKIALPLGISFIVFQKISFFIDFKRSKIQPESLKHYFYHILMFPKLLAGPIVRFNEIAGEIESHADNITNDMRLSGFFRFSVGLAKKVLIANVLGDQLAEMATIQTENLSSGILWLAALGYTFQIYFDFSGYSDMAIGLAQMMGFRFPENFNNPYTAKSITEFWRRWHITLSNWLRDYVFLPVAYSTSRSMKANRYLNVKTEQWLYMIATMITMFICGIWHGAAWTFILWGIYQGVIMVLERLFLLRLYKKTKNIPAVPVTFFLTIMGWVVFSSESVSKAFLHIKLMSTFSDMESMFHFTSKYYTILIIAFVCSFTALSKRVANWQDSLFLTGKSTARYLLNTLLALVLFTLSLSAVTASGFNPFIYFRF